MARRARKKLPIPNRERLENAALFYLGRYAASEASLRRVLQNRLRRAGLVHPNFARDAAAQQSLRNDIETIIEKYRKSGVLNDAAYAGTKVNSLRRSGRSKSYIRQKLGRAGVTATQIDDALAEAADGAEPHEAEMKAAITFARRRKLGPYRSTPADTDRQRKDLAALARAGFPLDIARKVLRATIDDDDMPGDFT